MADHIWDWDLYAVVRGYTYAATASTAVAAIPPPPVVPNTTPFHHDPTTTTTLSPLATLTFREDQNDPFAFPNLSQPPPPITTQSHHTLQELQQLLLPTDQNHHRHLHLQNQMNLEFPQSQPANSGVNLVKKQAQAQAPRSRKRKVQLKKMVCRVTAENVSTDLWAWRKYGQKPIKGSPFPRNYYRCSSNKGCAARKQVERSVTDPETFVVTYTGDHSHPPPTHRNSLAGSTRSKPSSTAAAKAKAHAAQAGGSDPPACPENNEEAAAEETESPGESYPSTEPDSQKRWSDDDEEIMMIPNMSAMTEDIFLGLNPFGGGGESSGGSSPTSQLGSVPHDSVSGTSRFSPG